MAALIKLDMIGAGGFALFSPPILLCSIIPLSFLAFVESVSLLLLSFLLFVKELVSDTVSLDLNKIYLSFASEGRGGV